MALEYINEPGRIWSGEPDPVNGFEHPINIGDVWTDAQLAAIGLRRYVPEPVPPAPITTTDVFVAKQRVAVFADELAAMVTGPVPATERASWPTKEIAARAYLDGVAPGTATATQVAMLQAEANLTGETLAVLAQKVVDNADAYVAIAGRIAGQRRVTIAALDALELGVATGADIDAVLATARTQAETMLAQALGT